MSDFIKVNFKHGGSVIFNTCNIAIHAIPDDGYFVSDISLKLSHLIAVIGNNIKSGPCLVAANTIFWDTIEITKEEYDRLCKELGVEP